MSGMEVAGLVLAGFPLIISALEHYRSCFEPLKDWWKFRVEFAKFVNDLEIEAGRFDMNLEMLLNPFVTSDFDMNRLIEDPGGDAWKDPDLQYNLRQRLQKSHDNFMFVVKDMCSELESLNKRLKIEKMGNMPTEASKWERELLRLRVSFSKQKFKHVEQLASGNTKLKDLLGSSNDLAGPRLMRKRKGMASFIQGARQRITNLYSNMQKGWKCGTHPSHSCLLDLEKLHTNDRPESVRISLLFEAQPDLQHIEVEISDTLLDPSLTPVAPLSLFEGQTVNPQPQKSRVRKVLRFQEIDQPKAPSIKRPSAVPLIRDLCSTLSGCSSPGCLGYLSDLPQFRHSFFVGHSESVPYEDNLLQDLAQAILPTVERPYPLAIEHRLKIALVMASSLPLLDDTQWITGSWDKGRIFFLHNDMHQHPYLFQQFCTSVSSAQPPHIQGCTVNVYKRSFLALGILILELAFGEALENQQFRKEFLSPDGNANDQTDLCTANKWQEKVQEKFGHGLASVIKRCLDCSFRPTPDWNNMEFVESVVEDVIQPLDRFVAVWTGRFDDTHKDHY